jgi:L-phenylalanine/L-methionine N-acetyltransferase
VSQEPDSPSTPAPPPGDGLVIRAARPADAEGIAALMNLPGYRWGTLRLPHQPPEAVRKRIEGLDAASTTLLAAVRGGLVVGEAGLDRFQGRRSHAGTIGIGVHDGHLRRGVGTALLGELLELADRWLGLKRVELTVYADNEAALAPYARHGFEVEGTHRAFALRDGALVDALAMARLRA